MAEPKYGTIKLDSPRAVFYAGQEITGSLEIELESPLTFSVIYVKFLGEATVKWTEQESEVVGGYSRYKNVNYVGREEYFNVSQLLAGSYGTNTYLNPGKHTYPFRYEIPPGVPSSFRGDRGSVAYSARGCVEFQGQPLYHEMVQLFDVVAPFDLNKGNARVKEPINLEFEEVVGCGCLCSSAPVAVRVHLPVSAYCPGQAVPVAVEVDNQSSVEITAMIFELLTRQRYKSQRPISEYIQPEQVLGSVKRGSIMSGTKRNFTVDLVVPDLIAPNLENCSIIDVGYFLRVTIKLSGCNEDLQDEVEICLGLVPLRETCAGAYVHPLAHSLPPGPVPDLPDVPPPLPGLREHSILNTHLPLEAAAALNGAYGFMEVHKQVISSDPSQNYEMGFKVSYPPGAERPTIQHHMQQFPQAMPLPADGSIKVQFQSFNMTSRDYSGAGPTPSAPTL